jgi:hypothetical protein
LENSQTASPFRPLTAQNSGMKQKRKPKQKGKTASYYPKKSIENCPSLFSFLLEKGFTMTTLIIFRVNFKQLLIQPAIKY